MQLRRYKRIAGFTLIEIMIVVAIIALLAAIAVPSAMRARKRSEAADILDDLKQLNAAIDIYATENGKSENDTFNGDVLRSFVAKNSVLYNNLKGDIYYDRLGNFYHSDGKIGDGIGLEQPTYDALSDVLPSDYWQPYTVWPGP